MSNPNRFLLAYYRHQTDALPAHHHRGWVGWWLDRSAIPPPLIPALHALDRREGLPVNGSSLPSVAARDFAVDHVVSLADCVIYSEEAWLQGCQSAAELLDRIRRHQDEDEIRRASEAAGREANQELHRTLTEDIRAFKRLIIERELALKELPDV